MKNLFNEIFTDLFGTEEEFYDHLKETFKSLDEGKSEKDEKDEDVKSYGYYDKKVYKNNKLYDHLEKKYENGKCYSLKHNPNHGVTDELPCCEKKCVENKCEHEQQKCCKGEKDVSAMEELTRLENENKKLKEDQKELLSTLDTIRNTAQELMATLKLYEEENTQLREKLNNIKKMF